MKTLLVFWLLSVCILPPSQQEISSVQVKTWADGKEIHGSTTGAEAVFQLPGRMVEVRLSNCIVVVNNEQVILDVSGFVDTNPNGTNPTFWTQGTASSAKTVRSFVVRPYFKE